MAAAQVLRSEWTKIKSVNSTAFTLGLAVLVSVGLGMLISAFTGNEFDKMSTGDKLTFDPTFISFSGLSSASSRCWSSGSSWSRASTARA